MRRRTRSSFAALGRTRLLLLILLLLFRLILLLPFPQRWTEKSKRRRVHRVIARECSDDFGGAPSERGHSAPSAHSCGPGSLKTWPRTTTWRPSVPVGLRNQATRSGQWPPPAPCSPRFLLRLAVDVPTRSARVMVHLRLTLATLQKHTWKCSVSSVQRDKSTMFFVATLPSQLRA